MSKILFLKKKNEKGFTLLFAVLIATLVVSIGASIISIALRQTILSGTSRESQYAFYAANTVLECAFYWDIIGLPEVNGEVVEGVVFPADGEVGLTTPEQKAEITCAGLNIINGDNTDEMKEWDQDGSTTTFYLKIHDRNPVERNGQGLVGPGGADRCAQATVTKTDDGSTITTRIEARGYNTCDTSNPRRVERGLVQEYQS
jgi:type II secretory pathway pseudopilin PulG